MQNKDCVVWLELTAIIETDSILLIGNWFEFKSFYYEFLFNLRVPDV